MGWVHQEFAFRALSHLPRFRQVTGTAQFKLNCRCPVCGDSQKDELKARFWAYTNGDDVLLKCYNCDYTKPIGLYLKDNEPDLYREFITELYKSKTHSKPQPKQTEISEKLNAKLPVIEKLNYCERLDRLPKEHPIVKYIIRRCIPEKSWKRLWFTNQWPALVNSINPGTYKNEANEPRLVIPIFNRIGEIESFQGRALRADAPQKYITIKAHDKATKIYGTDTVDESKLVFVMEGPIDSLFIPNAIAITGGSIDLDVVPYKGNRAWIMDAEDRHPDTIKRMQRLVDANEKVVFWDKWNKEGKDINEFIQNGATVEQLVTYINDNIAQGLMAKLRLQKYRKI